MLRKIRITLALVCLVLITLLFLDFTGTVQPLFGWLTKIQALPAVLALNVGVVLLLIALTLLFGRLYCSVICPLGVFQDVVSWISGKFKKNRFRYTAALPWLRYPMLGIFILLMVAGITAWAALLAPYSAYGRMATNLFAPIYQWGNNLLASLEPADSYHFYTVEIWIRSLPVLIIAGITFVVLTLLAWLYGRAYCNTICPVGTVLGFLSRYSLFRPVIDTSRCNGGHRVARNCKASCINSKNLTIDYSRCVTCFDCIDQCKQGAIRYVPRTQKNATTQVKTSEGNSRRQFLTLTGMLATSALLHAQKKVDGELAVIEDKKIPSRNTPIVPPGALSIKNLSQHCTTCQLCISVCPNQVLRPSGDTMKLMQPTVSYERGYCRPECTRCSNVCPTGAIRPISVAEKSSIQIGQAVWIKKNCLPATEGIRCNNCARHCPTGAIQMVPLDATAEKSAQIPVVNTERCIGCGACENLCPARPFSAIYVEGNEKHRII